MHSKIRFLTRVGIAGALILTLSLLVVPQMVQAQTSQATAATNRSHVKNFQHVFLIMMENTSYGSLIGNTNAPWINFAAAHYGLATSYFGVTHPSQPNYFAITSGSTQGVTSDDTTTITAPNIVDQLEAQHKSWKAYMQSIFSDGNTDKLASTAGDYGRKHDPFVSYADVQNNPARMANVVDFSQFALDLARNHVPDFSWISPDACHDMHGHGTSDANDPCNYNNEQQLIALGDAFLQTTVNEIMHSRAWNGNSAIFITWDESDFPFGDTGGCCDANPGGGRVVTLVISHDDHHARTSNAPYNHYSLLATIEDSWHLGCLNATCDTANVPPMSDLVGPRG